MGTSPVASIQGLYAYHRWANRVLFTVAEGLGEETAARPLGTQFSFPSLKATFVHLYGADTVWLDRWRGRPTAGLPTDAEFGTLAELRQRWDGVEEAQRAFVDALTPEDLDRVVAYRDARGTPYALPLGPLLQHVANHGTHHRSEVATMLTMVSGSPPLTDLVYFQLIASGQLAPY